MEEEPDFEYDDSDDDDDDGTYYYCPCCNYSCVERPAFGGQCPHCVAIMEESRY